MSKVRLATKEDVEDIIELNQQVLGLHASLYPEDFKPRADPAELRAMFTWVLAEPAHLVAVHDGAGRAEGYVWIELQERAETALTLPSTRIYVHHIGVADAARRRGVGSTLIRWVERHAASIGVRRIVLEHWTANDSARAFFARAGFSPVKMALRKG